MNYDTLERKLTHNSQRLELDSAVHTALGFMPWEVDGNLDATDLGRMHKLNPNWRRFNAAKTRVRMREQLDEFAKSYHWDGWTGHRAGVLLRHSLRNWKLVERPLPAPTGWKADAIASFERMTGGKYRPKEWPTSEQQFKRLVARVARALFKRHRKWRGVWRGSYAVAYPEISNFRKGGFMRCKTPPWVWLPRFEMPAGKDGPWLWTGPITYSPELLERPASYSGGRRVDILNYLAFWMMGRELRPTERIEPGPGTHDGIDVNPARIRLNLTADGRGGKHGARNANAKLTLSAHNELLSLHQKGVGPSELAGQFAISRQQVYRIIRGTAWNPQISYGEEVQ